MVYTGIRSRILYTRPTQTRGVLKIDILPAVVAVIEICVQELKLPTISTQIANDYFKEICKLAESSEPVPYTRHCSKERIHDAKSKDEFIGTHSARPTFVTLSVEK